MEKDKLQRRCTAISPFVRNLLPASCRNLPKVLYFFDRLFHKSRCIDYVFVCVYQLHEWCVLAHWVFFTGLDALYKSYPLINTIIVRHLYIEIVRFIVSSNMFSNQLV